MAKWPYNTDTWRKLRLAKLAASPLCEPCHMRGRLKPANTVDHKVSIASGGPAFPPLAGLMCMCHECHNTKTNAVDRKGGKGVAFKGCGFDGMPIDPSHPFHGEGAFKDDHPRAVDRCGGRMRTKFGIC